MNKLRHCFIMAFFTTCLFVAARAKTDTDRMTSHNFSPLLYHTTPYLSVISHVSAMTGNSDEPAETVLTLQITNDGNGTAYDVTCFLNDTARYNIHGGKAVLGTITPGDSRQAVFTITEQITSSGKDTISVAITERYGHFPDIIKILPVEEMEQSSTMKITSEKNPYCLNFTNHIHTNGPGTTRALLIGNRMYHDSSLPKREYAIRDVRAVRDCLASLCVSHDNAALTYSNIGHSEMGLLLNKPDSLSYYLGEPGNGDNLLFYFNGYGFITGEDNTLYLAPVDCLFNTKDIPKCGYNLIDLYKLAGKVFNGTVTFVLDITILDASGNTTNYDFQNFREYLPNGVLITSGNSTGHSYPHEESRHSLMTFSLLKGLNDATASGAAYITCADIKRMLTTAPFSVPSLETVRFRGGTSMPVIIGDPDNIVLNLE